MVSSRPLPVVLISPKGRSGALWAALLFGLLVASGCSGPSRAPLDAWPQGRLGTAPPDELWVIERASSPHAPPPGLAALRVADAPRNAPDPLVLESVAVSGTVTGPVASLALAQTFRNPHPHTLDAEFNFPLPPHASITGFEVAIGTRRIRAIIRERAEAQAMYAAARRDGLRAALLTETEPGFFSHRVGAVPARGRVRIALTYDDVLTFAADGWWTLSVPLRTHWTHHGHGAPTLAATLDIEGAPDAVEAHCPSHAAEVAPRTPGLRLRLERAPLAGDALVVRVRPFGASPGVFVAEGDERVLLRVEPGAVRTERLEPDVEAPFDAVAIESSGRGPVHRLWVRRETYAAREASDALADMARKHGVVTPLTGLLIVDPTPPDGG